MSNNQLTNHFIHFMLAADNAAVTIHQENFNGFDHYNNYNKIKTV